MSLSSAPADRPEVIRADRLEVAYPAAAFARAPPAPVWKEASFSIREGEFVAVIGPNGAGKTTLFRLLLGLLRPRGGALTVFGRPPQKGSRRIGYVPQIHAVDKDTNVAAEHLVRMSYAVDRYWSHFGEFGGESRAVKEALQAVGAYELRGKPLGRMSGGELQRIFIAEAIVSRPQLLLLDEPLASLDIKRTHEMVELIHGLVQSRGVTTLLVAHDINPLIRCLDKVIYVANRKVATGAPEEVLTTSSLSALYGVPVEVLHDSRGNLVIVGAENAHQDEGPA